MAANVENLKPVKTKEEARERGRKGGIASGKARKEKKTIQAILNAFLEQDVKDVNAFKPLAKKLGLEDEASVKELVSLIYLRNSIKTGDLMELERLVKLIGENEKEEEKNNGMLDEINAYLKEKRKDESNV